MVDEDGAYTTAYGPFGVDDVRVEGGLTRNVVTYDFETSLQGWTASKCPALGSFFSIQPISRYNILDPCACGLQEIPGGGLS